MYLSKKTKKRLFDVINYCSFLKEKAKKEGILALEENLGLVENRGLTDFEGKKVFEGRPEGYFIFELLKMILSGMDEKIVHAAVEYAVLETGRNKRKAIIIRVAGIMLEAIQSGLYPGAMMQCVTFFIGQEHRKEIEAHYWEENIAVKS